MANKTNIYTVQLHFLKKNKKICPMQGSNLQPHDYIMLFITSLLVTYPKHIQESGNAT